MKVYNTLTRKKEEFKPIEKDKVTIYTCGPTVYDFFHIGNARVFVTFDMIRRYLEFRGYEVKFVQNFTDIEDKMIRRSQEEGITVKELGDKFIEEYFKDAKALGVEKATVHPRATEHIDDIIELIKILEEKGYAYEVDGVVYYSTRKFKNYGKLSHQNIDELESGARIQPGEKKRDPLDFVLWKAQKPGEPAWDSPWGKGRPGWHIECSAMSMKYLGETFDIHGGGPDLVFPHHENEIAQSEAATGKPFANYFMHVGYLNIDNKKMSKSLGNFFTVREIVEKYDPEIVRFFMLSAHYRNPINFSQDLLEQAKKALERFYNALYNMNYLEGILEDRELTSEEEKYIEKLDEKEVKFIKAMDDDFNTADAIAVLFDIVRDFNLNINESSAKQLVVATKEKLLSLGDVLGFFRKFADSKLLDNEVEKLIKQREEARKNKNYALADEIRDKLQEQGIILEDTPSGVRWKRI